MNRMMRTFAAVALLVLGLVTSLSVLAAGGGAINYPGNSPSASTVTGAGTPGTIPLWTGATTLGDSLMTEAAGTDTATGNFAVKGTTSLGSAAQAQVNATGHVFAPLGATGAGNLAYSFVGDTDTGWYRSATGQVTLSLDGTDRATFYSLGALQLVANANTRPGYGISNASAGVLAGAEYGASNDTGLSVSFGILSSTATIPGTDIVANEAYYLGNSAPLVVESSSSYVRFGTNAVERMRILSGGNVGIGDSTPASMLTVGAGDTFQVNSSGNLVKLNNVAVSAPASQGAANTFLRNDGAGNWTWVEPNVTTTNCLSNSGTPACGGFATAGAGLVAIDDGTTSVVITNTTISTSSEIVPYIDMSAGAALGGQTCNTTYTAVWISARTAATSFTIQVAADPAGTDRVCVGFTITNRS